MRTIHQLEKSSKHHELTMKQRRLISAVTALAVVGGGAAVYKVHNDNKHHRLVSQLERPYKQVKADYDAGKIDHSKVIPVTIEQGGPDYTVATELAKGNGNFTEIEEILNAQEPHYRAHRGDVVYLPNGDAPRPK